MQKRQVVLIGICLAAAIILGLAQFWGQSLPTGAWGLSFQREGQPPNAPATREILKNYDAYYIGNTEDKTLYLTFDAGYENGCTAGILDILKAHQVSAAFFLTGNYMEKNPDLVRRMVAEGHLVGNHTMHHPQMDKLGDLDTFRAELEGLEHLYKQVTGEDLPKFYRPPQGIYSEENLKNAQNLGYKTIFWSLAYVDWLDDKQPTEAAAFGKLLPRLHNGAILLLHSTSKTNAKILDRFLTECESRGYRFGTLEELTA
ncbi:MAG: polysaccharide deacetylase family protein [Oscillospiraceae bacterium]|nr:polysaccharide deacetylase family protein [Oscillospiraceae bacterium]